jgi:hypothetical protein
MAKLYPTLALGAGETPASFVSRIAALHRHDKARHFATDMAMNFQLIADGDEATIMKVGKLCGADHAELMRNALVRQGAEYRLRGERLIKTSTRFTRLRGCPQCAAENAASSDRPPEIALYGRAIWQIEHIRTCPIHNLALVDFTEEEQIRDLHDFAAMAGRRAEKILRLPHIRRAPSGMETYLLGRLNGAQGDQTFLDGLPFFVAAKFCEVLGAVAIHGRDISLKALDDSMWRDAGEAGFAIAAGGEPAIRAFMSNLQRTYAPGKRTANEGPQGVFGTLYKWTTFYVDGPDYDSIRDLMFQHVVETMPVGPGETYFKRTVQERRIHSIRSAAVTFDVHPKRLRKILAAKSLIPPDHQDCHDNHLLMDAAKVQTLYDDGIITGLTQKDVEVYLGAGRVQTKLLVDAGIVVPAISTTDLSDHSAWSSFPKKDLDAFLARLMQDAITVASAGKGQHNIPGAARRANCSAIEIVRMILDRKLSWVGRLTTKEKYMAVLVNVDEIKAKTQTLPPLDGLTAQQVQKALKTTHAVVRALIEHEILKRERRINPVNRCPVTVVPVAEFERFQNTYVSLTTLAKERGLHPLQVKKILDEEQIEPALEPALFYATFYRRHHLPNDRNKLNTH